MFVGVSSTGWAHGPKGRARDRLTLRSVALLSLRGGPSPPEPANSECGLKTHPRRHSYPETGSLATDVHNYRHSLTNAAVGRSDVQKLLSPGPKPCRPKTARVEDPVGGLPERGRACWLRSSPAVEKRLDHSIAANRYCAPTTQSIRDFKKILTRCPTTCCTP